MFRHVREYHKQNIHVMDLAVKISDTEVSYDYEVGRNVLVPSLYIEGWIHSLGEICADSKLKHANQHTIYQESVQALVDGLNGDKGKVLAFIGGTELAKEYTRD